MKKKILIIGAGPAGMACAMELFRKGISFTLVDKDKQVGGLSKTYKFGKFRTDNGPHRFFSKNKYLYGFIEDILQEDWIVVNRSTRQFIDGKYYDYPINAIQAFKNIGIKKALIMFLDYVSAAIQYRVFGKKIRSFEDYIVANFGRTLGEFNMLNYTEKIWGMSCKLLHPEWARQRIKGLSFRSALIGAVRNSLSLKNLNTPKTMIDQFYYPSHGTGQIYEKIKEKIEKKNEVLLNDYPIHISHTKKRISTVLLNSGKEIPVHRLVSSIPIGLFINLLDPPAPEKIIAAANKLKFRSQVYLFVTINKKRLTKDQWIYFPSLGFPIGRISEMKNFSDKMAPPDKTSLFVEFFCWEGDDIWKMSKGRLFEITIKNLEKIGLLKRSNVINYYYFKKEYVYPVYDLQYKKNLKVIQNYLDEFSNLIYIGRPGRFKYTNQDHSLEMGILAARSIITKKRLNVENVGAEKEYFEKGYAPKN